MHEKVRIKDIAEMAGVSPGTVDRVIHNRGRVSETARIAVEEVMKKVNYRPNIHITGLSLKRRYRVVITTPNVMEGEYWESIHAGIRHALEEYENIRVKCLIYNYNQYDIYSCREVYNKIAKIDADAVIIGTTFKEETVRLSKELDKKEIPYILVDSMVENTSPLAYFTSDHYICGYLVAKLITSIIPINSEIGMVQAVRIGDESANSSILRKKGFQDYLTEEKITNKIKRISVTAMEPEKYDEQLRTFFKDHPNIGGVVVLNSRGGIVADFFARKGIRDKKMICVDLTVPNVRGLKDGYIDFLIGQEPEHQGFLAMKTLIEYLIYRHPVKVQNYIQLDILTKETIVYYKQFNFIS
ncbi:LacI family DNA-binding transcriptional regulator [Proteiniphilum sp. UBA1028]|jgi:LacI family transcriptional regulator|uniref:LacI family DNA-binding transcriptional regulator n=1 Tax=Proteiniphilum sp. UBA1028 TaxID=1947251 RepID=UPI0025CCC486|nr:LacI family DNA-binding transcriptional regulator [Proteiniphilum sp. UBA1028]